MIDTILVLSSVALMLDARLRSALVIYLTFTGATLWLSFPREHTPYALAFFAAIAAVKMIASPLLIVWMVRRYGVPENLTASFNIAWRIVVAIAAVALGAAVAHMDAFAHVARAGAVFTALFSSTAVVVLHRNLLAHMIGLLMLGSAISLAGAVFAPGLSGATELADAFDAVISALVAFSVARSIIAFDPRLDVRSLRGLRG